MSQYSDFQIFVVLSELEELILKKNIKRTKVPKTELKRTKDKSKKNQEEPLGTKWQFWYFPHSLFFTFYKMVVLVGGGSVINGAYPI